MENYEVTIIETMRRTVKVKAKSMEEAKYKVECNYYSEKYILDADDFAGVSFDVKKRNLTKE